MWKQVSHATHDLPRQEHPAAACSYCDLSAIIGFCAGIAVAHEIHMLGI
jgi:hypothetical protein